MTHLSANDGNHLGRPERSWLLVMIIGACTLLPCVGCGENQEDMMMRAARRKRPTSDSENGETPKNRPAKVERSKNKANSPATAIAKGALQTKPEQNSTTAEGETESPASVELKIATIQERGPEKPLSESKRRARAYENLVKLSEALLEFYRKNNRYPKSHARSASGIATLSWRVELLPYLGHDDLYQRFDFSKPWDMEPNKSLLDYIPDAYVSPERFDTSTNFLLPADKSFMFGENRSPRLNGIEDGADNTIMLVEVNDSLAVPWTKPADYAPEDKQRLADDLGDLRGDGTFALWANGWTVLLADGLKDQQLFNAMTHETGDGQRAGDIHRAIAIEEVTDAALAAKPAETPVETTSQMEATGPEMNPQPREPQYVREAVPKAGQIAAAQARLRQIYAQRMGDAKKDDEKVELAEEMLDNAAEMPSDSAGAYALMTAAMRLASDAGAPSLLIQAIDQRVGRFEVDAYEENAAWLTRFGQVALSRDAETVDGMDLLSRSVRVIYAGIEDNDFSRASGIARIAYRYTGEEPRETIPRLLKRIRLLLAAANKEYDTASEHLATYRTNPSDQDAGAALGRFLCFIKGDWTKGLPLLAESDREQLQELARRDLHGAADNYNQAALGDAWWDLSERARGGVYRQAARDRALYWYQQAYATMPDSLDRMHVKSRIDEADEMDGSSPIALCVQLADELGVELTVSLAAIADVGQRRGRRHSYDDDDDD